MNFPLNKQRKGSRRLEVRSNQIDHVEREDLCEAYEGEEETFKHLQNASEPVNW